MSSSPSPDEASSMVHQLAHYVSCSPADALVALAAVKDDPGALEYASEESKRDREVVLAAVQGFGLALEDASDELKGDREVGFAAV